MRCTGVMSISLPVELAPVASCCGASAAEDARRVADKIGIEHFVLDFRREFSEFVVDYFVNEYVSGKTPNPCIACNKFLKFDAMAAKADILNAEYIATGHYAKIEYNEDIGRYLLKRANADAKDQTYALYNLTQKQMARLLWNIFTSVGLMMKL